MRCLREMSRYASQVGVNKVRKAVRTFMAANGTHGIPYKLA